MPHELPAASKRTREHQKRNMTEAVAATLRFLRPPRNGNGAKPTESSKAAEPVDDYACVVERTTGDAPLWVEDGDVPGSISLAGSSASLIYDPL